MITSEEWEKIMTFTGYGNTARAKDTYTTKPDLSGSAYKGTADTYDLTKNIYDLAGNVWEWTLKANDTSYRVNRGGCYSYVVASCSASFALNYCYPVNSYDYSYYGSRLALYIK